MVGVGVEGSEKEVRQLGGMPGIRMNLDPACFFFTFCPCVVVLHANSNLVSCLSESGWHETEV